jgi:hypothetical protein
MYPYNPNQRKILRCFDTHTQILWEKKLLGHSSTFFKTLQPNKQEAAQNFEQRVLQKCLRISFYP